MAIEYIIPVRELKRNNSREVLEIVIPRELHLCENTNHDFIKEEK